MKTAILIAGEYREFVAAHKFWSFLKWPDVDCYFATWDKSVFVSYNTEVTIEYINETSITDYINPVTFQITPTTHISIKNTSRRMIDRWQESIRMMLNSNIIYDRVILIRPDIALDYDEILLKNYIATMPVTDNILYGITSYTLNVPIPLVEKGKVSDLILVGSPGAIKKLLDLNKPSEDEVDVHGYLAENFIRMGISLFNLPIYKQCIVRSNSRGQNLTFDEYQLKSKEWWERRYNQFYSMGDNYYETTPGHLNSNRLNNANSVNLWDKFDYTVWKETKQAALWHSPDSEDRFDRNVIDPKFRHFITYGKKDLDYTFNSLGFRVNGQSGPIEFEDATGYPKVLVGGCSVTEGIGLPEHHIWHSFLLNKFSKNHSSMPIAKFNVGKGGIGISAAIRYAYVAIEHYNFKPDVVFLCLPPVGRNEFLLHDDKGEPIIYHYIPGMVPEQSSPALVKQTYQKTVQPLNCRQYYHDCFKNLLFFKWFCEAKNIPWYFNFWAADFFINSISYNLAEGDQIDCSIPKELLKHFIPVVNGSESGPFKQTIARDYMHFGPNVHYNLANKIYEYLITDDRCQQLLEKWKKL